QNQGWKDSGDAIVYPDGTQVSPPIASCEEQGFVHAAKLQLSEVLWSLGHKDQASRLFHEAAELKRRFNEKYWMEDAGYFAMGLMRYGLHDLVEKICRAQFEAAALFDFYRLPELFSGHQRDPEHPFPAYYLAANWPQAWSASAMFSLLQAMLGLYPYAPLHTLLLDPRLPEWLPEITLENLHVGAATLKIRFFRKTDGTSDYKVLEKNGHVHVLHQPSPWSLTVGYAERIKDAITSLLPGK